MTSICSYLRPDIASMAGYAPGEQPRVADILKLNTNENPYPPPASAMAAIAAFAQGGAERLRKYPDPVGTDFRAAAARVLGVGPGNILIGNGSDDILTILTRAFVPQGGVMASPTPSYLLYETLARLQGARFETVPFTSDWGLPAPWPLKGANLTFLPNPNSPSGTVVSNDVLRRLAGELGGPLVVDEAYADFADTNALELVREGLPVVVTRTLSKGYGLAGLRFGFAVADAALVEHLVKVKDSYNCDALSLAAATAAITDQAWLADNRAKVVATRRRLAEALARLGFLVTPSNANFVWCRHPSKPAEELYARLKERAILVRLMRYPQREPGLRVTVGTEEGTDRFLGELSRLLT
jgi:histidinol-phosphate aminotransferase